MQHGEMGGIEVSRMIDPFRSGESHIAVLFLRSHFPIKSRRLDHLPMQLNAIHLLEKGMAFDKDV